jgi:hypothetical protein
LTAALALALALAAAPARGEAATVQIEGVLAHTGAGPVRVELLTEQTGGQPPLLAWSGWIDGPGPFRLAVPIDLGEVRLRAAADLDGDGVGPLDPQGRLANPLRIGRAPITGIELTLILPGMEGPPDH